MSISKNPDFIPTAALRKKFLACISDICGAAKFFSSGQPKGYPALKLRFPRLAFGRTLNF
jgi:hypothetical protein